MHSCFTSCIFAARTLDFAVRFRLVFRYEAVVFRRYVLALLSVGLLRKFEAYLVYLSLIWTKNPRRCFIFSKILPFHLYVAMVSPCQPQFSRANWWHAQSFFSSVDLAPTAVKWVRMLKPRPRDRARVGMDCTTSIETSKRQNGGRFKFRGMCFISRG